MSATVTPEAKTQIVVFLAITFAISWTVAAVIYISPISYGSAASLVLVAIGYMWAPGFAALFVAWRSPTSVRRLLGLYLGRLRWVALAWTLPVALVGVTIGVGALFPGIAFTTDPTAFLRQAGLSADEVATAMALLDAVPLPAFVLFAAQGLAAGLTINAVAALGEELGWRGLLLHALAPLGFWKASLVIGAIWGIWHAPLIVQGHNYPGAPIAGAIMMTVACTALAPVLTYVTVRAGTVFAAAFFHGTLNGVGTVSLIYLAGADPLIASPVGVAGIVAAMVLLAACLMHDRRSSSGSITTGEPLVLWVRRTARDDSE